MICDFPFATGQILTGPSQKRQRTIRPILYRRGQPRRENGNYIRASMQDGATTATARNPARGDLFIARARPRFILFFSGAAAEANGMLRKIRSAPVSER